MTFKHTDDLARANAAVFIVLISAAEAAAGYNAPASGGGDSSSAAGTVLALLVIGGAIIAGVALYIFKKRPGASDAMPSPSYAQTPAPAAPVNGAGSIFISYRREDSADVTGRINERLTRRYGQNVVFQDIDNIPLGVDFRQHLDRALGRCSVLLAIIGDKWIEKERGSGERRIDDPRDHLRLELETALRREIPVIPVLVRKAVVPAEQELPDSLKPLAFRNGIQVRPDPDFNTDMDRLLKGIESYLNR